MSFQAGFVVKIAIFVMLKRKNNDEQIYYAVYGAGGGNIPGAFLRAKHT